MSGLRTESTRTPKASRAGALYGTERYGRGTERKVFFQDQVDNLTVGAALFGFGASR